MADRESDIYEAFARRPSRTDLVIRAQHDRFLEDGSRLYDSLNNSSELGRETIELPASSVRRARRAVLVLKARPITLKKPKNHNDGRFSPQTLPKALTLTLVEARESNPPDGVAPAHWRLLTTHDVTTFAQALQITHFYRQRWTIEQVFRIMKTKGFNIEAVRVAEDGPFENLSAATLIAYSATIRMRRLRQSG